MKLLPTDPIARDLVVFLVIKLVLIVAIWAAFFRAPDGAQKTADDPAAVQRALLDRSPAALSNETKGQQ